ncbi:MAG: chromosome segregation protein SMC [Gammaproteobacteria bacterium]
MKLKHLKLAGFKSFVDTTTVPFPSSKVAILGPNGCGKSNVVDAIRWVMGESSAKYLRGDSMEDVIFNGSTGRKPVGQAMVELVFDNSDGSLAGEYANYAEIGVRRVVTRDGQSSYFINNTRCRKRDVVDIFLGTGLGPRSYAVIEQGMISRFVSAKPEELRIYLEEAAGISKYKERRRETENRMQHTQENLNRISDVCEEHERQLTHLKRQANAAEKYKVLKQEERSLRAQLLALRWQELAEQLQTQSIIVQQHETVLESVLAEQQHIDTAVEKQRQLRSDAQQALQQVQERYYELGNAITQLEQKLLSQRERCQQLTEEQQRVERELNQTQHTLRNDQQQQQALQQQLSELEPRYQAITQQAQQAHEELNAVERVMREWQQQWNEFQQQLASANQQAQLQQARLQHLQQNHHQVEQRITRLTDEQAHHDFSEIQNLIDELQQQQQALLEQQQHKQTQLADIKDRITEQRDLNQENRQALDGVRGELQQLKGRYASLEALQQAALGKRNQAVVGWLAQHQLADNPRLAQGLNVEAGWETAVETVLGNYLQAVCVEQFSRVSELLTGFDEGQVILMNVHSSNTETTSTANANKLSSKVQAQWHNAYDLLNQVFIAEDLAQALNLQSQLQAHESVITRDGIWLGANWLRVSRDEDQQQGVLQREQELKQLADEIAQTEQRVNELEQQMTRGREQLVDYEQQREALQQRASELNAQVAEHTAQIKVQEGKFNQLSQRSEQINQELTQLQQQAQQQQADINQTQQQLQTAQQALQEQQQQRTTLEAQREQRQQQLDQKRQFVKDTSSEQHQLELQIKTVQTQVASIQQQLQRTEQQTSQLQQRQQTIATQLQEAQAPINSLATQLEQQLTKRSGVETELNDAKIYFEQFEQQLQGYEQQRHQLEQKLRADQSKLEKLRIDMQSLHVRRTTIEEQQQEAGNEMQQVLAEMPEDAAVQPWEQTLATVEQKIQRLGPINLAAIDEYQTQLERKTYLDTQLADLTEALDTLQKAIHKIDKETRTRFKETFDVVNTKFKELFPKLFGGGSASLELLGDDLLTTGVAMMARPPGKRNATVHLLSGGEKALTAISLVFAIFHLNPAPFCILDEVDAPLDDANVGRFCRLMDEMSKTVQFLFITHNKVTMEAADHLLGVTMNEPGVSRLVTVDMENAIAMAEA